MYGSLTSQLLGAQRICCTPSGVKCIGWAFFITRKCDESLDPTVDFLNYIHQFFVKATESHRNTPLVDYLGISYILFPLFDQSRLLAGRAKE